MVSGFVPKGLSSPFPSASDRLQGIERSETGMWLVLMGDRKIACPIFNIAKMADCSGIAPHSLPTNPKFPGSTDSPSLSPEQLKPQVAALC